MSFRFILGRAGSGKTRFCLEAVAQELRRSPDGPPLILLVPEQATFQMDRALVALPGIRATLRAKVLSFRRLAWTVLAETGGAARPHIDEIGKAMALRALLAGRAKELRVFGGSADKPGFVPRLARTLSELRTYNIRYPELERAYAALEALGRGETALAGKLHDLAVVSRDLEDYLAGRWADPDDYLGLLAQRLRGRPPSLAGARVWVDGFAGFTAQELDVLLALAEVTAEVSVALCVDPGEVAAGGHAAGRDRAPGRGRTPESRGRWNGPSTFYPARRTYSILLGRLAAGGLERGETTILGGQGRPRFAAAPALAHLEQEYPNPVPAPFTAEPGPAVTLVAAESRQAEVAAAAREMVRLAREEDYRWREMSLVARSLEPYAAIIEATLTDYGIPHFIDRRRPVTYHPLVEFARSAVEVAERDWDAGPLFRLLKTDLWPLPRAEVDLLENYVLAHGLRGRDVWTRDQPWQWRRVFALDETAAPDPAEEENLAAIDAIRRRVAGLLAPYAARLADPGPPGGPPPTFRDRAGALWELVEAAGVPDTLERWSRETAADPGRKGQPEQKQIDEQVLTGFVNLLDQMVRNLGDRPVSLADFGRALGAGLESLTVALVPPTLDQVMVGAIDRSRQPDVRVCFVLGLNDGVFPATSYDDQVFDDRERADLAEKYGLDLAPASREKALAEDYLAYIALTRSSERLWASYALSADDGRAMAPSLVVSRLRAVFPALEPRPASLEPQSPADLSAEAEALAQVARVLAEARRRQDAEAAGAPGPAVDPGWLEAYNWLVSGETEAGQARRERTRAALRSLGYRNRAARLDSQTALALYGQERQGRLYVSVSVSRLERYAGCPFSHFASAGLALEPRPKQQLKAPEIGSYYHAVLNLFTRGLLRDGLDLAALDRETVVRRLEKVVAEVAPRLESDILASRARYRYLAGRLQRTVGRTIEVLREHARRSGFRPVGTELRFSGGAQAGESLRLRGVVDRLEVAEAGGELLARVIDFKSAGKDFRLRWAESGLDIQLPAYLLAATRPGTAWETPLSGSPPLPDPAQVQIVPAGAFFFPVADPFVRADRPLADEELTRRRLEEVRVKGVVLGEPPVLRLMDRALDVGRSPDAGNMRAGRDPATGAAAPGPLLPVTLTATGAIRKSRALLDRQQMSLLLEFTRVKIDALAASILSGEIDILPVRKTASDTACRYCEYRPLCRFDPGAGDQYHRLPRLKDEEVWERMSEEVAAGGRRE